MNGKVRFVGLTVDGAMTFAGARPARANDGGISFGGTPRLLQQHPSVSMVSEVVRISVGDDFTTVDCRFRFKNRGAATTVRMGFPDRGEGGYDPYEELPGWDASPARTSFLSFHSYVDGKLVPTQLVKGKGEGEVWRSKYIRFAKNGTQVVRDIYTMRTGQEANARYLEAEYLFHTGASWHGTIGRTILLVSFHGKRPLAPLRPTALRSSPMEDVEWIMKVHKPSPRIVWYRGPCRPRHRGRTLRFVRTKWRPTENDDLLILFPSSRR